MHKPANWLICVAMIAMAIAGCGDFRSAKALDMTVLDSHTGRPVPEAFVIVRWGGHFRSWMGPAEGSACTHIEWAQTDKDGIARIPAWNADVGRADAFFWQKILFPEVEPDDRVNIQVVRLGYLPKQLNAAEQNLTLRIDPFHGDLNQQILKISPLWFGCRLDDRDAREKLRGYLHAETYVRTLEPSKERDGILDGLRREITRLQVLETY